MSRFDNIAQPNFKSSVIYKDASNQNIITALQDAISPATIQTKEIARSFKGSSNEKTAANIWHFLKTNVRYKPDGLENQNIKFPSRLLSDGVGDCKSMSLFTASVLKNLGIPFSMRYTSYDSDTTPTHVYCVVTPGNIPIDGVYNLPNKEADYKYKKDYKMDVKYLTGLNGIGDLKSWWKGVTQDIKTGTLLPARAAYILLVTLNFKGFATKLNALIENNPTVLHDKWYKLGGNFTELKNAIAKGKAKRPIFGIDPDFMVMANPGIFGHARPIGSVAATVATASAVIIALAPLISLAAKYMNKETITSEDVSSVLEAGGGIEVNDENLQTLLDTYGPGVGAEALNRIFATSGSGEETSGNLNTGGGWVTTGGDIVATDDKRYLPAPDGTQPVKSSMFGGAGLLIGLGLVAALATGAIKMK